MGRHPKKAGVYLRSAAPFGNSPLLPRFSSLRSDVYISESRLAQRAPPTLIRHDVIGSGMPHAPSMPPWTPVWYYTG